jgi:hypothetical protein
MTSMFKRGGERERELERAFANPDAQDLHPEAADLARLARDLRRLDSSPIDERRVWLRVRAGMLAEPQARPGRLPGIAAVLAFGTRPALATAVAVVLLAVAVAGSVLLQPQQSASAAFLERVQQIVDASGAAAGRGALTEGESSALESQALGLLEQASRGEVLSTLRSTEAQLALQRIQEARSALAVVLANNPGDARALAALAAVSGLLSTPESAAAAPGAAVAPPGDTSQPPASASTPEATAAVSKTPQAEATRTPEPEDGRSRGAAPASTPSATAVALAAVQSTCARVFDAASLGACAAQASLAAATCAEARGGAGCQAALEAAVANAERRVQRVGEDCQRLPTSRSREACAEVTNKGRSEGSRTDENRGRSGSGQRRENDSRGDRD